MLCFLHAQDVQKAKQFLPFLQRAGKTEALVEFVASGSRLRLYVPKETCLITLLLSGIYKTCFVMIICQELRQQKDAFFKQCTLPV